MSLLNRLKRKYRTNNFFQLFSKEVQKSIFNGDYIEALTLCLEGTQQFPHYLPGKLMLAKCHMLVKDWNNAMMVYQNILSHSPDCLGALKGIHHIYTSLEKEQEAFNILQRIMNIDPEDEEIKKMFQDSNNTVKVKSFDENQNSIDEREVFTPTLAEIYRKQGLIQQSLNIYEKLYQQNPEKTDFYKKIQEIKLSLN